MQKIVAITGGIGSGKSVVSSILRTMGLKVYDSDNEARILMDNSPHIKETIQKVFGKSIISNGLIDRKKLSEIVFSDKKNLEMLNEIVHGAVKKHFSEWTENIDDPVVFIETAILYESGLDKYVSDIWEVTAPEDLKIKRVMTRSNMSETEIRKRIEAQNRNCNSINKSNHQIINNCDETALLPQIIYLLDKVHKSL